MNTELVSVHGAIIWEDRPRRWWHRVIWWKRPRSVRLDAPPPGQQDPWAVTWDADGVFHLNGPGE